LILVVEFSNHFLKRWLFLRIVHQPMDLLQVTTPQLNTLHYRTRIPNPSIWNTYLLC
jgi:hypothetical protein